MELMEEDAIPSLPKLPAAEDDEGVEVSSWNGRWPGDQMYLMDCKIGRQLKSQCMPEGSCKRILEDQVLCRFQLALTQVTSTNVPSSRLGL